MGGGFVWRLLASGEPRLAAAVPFYGPTPDNPDFAGSKDVAVLGIYAAQDQRVNATEPVARAALEKAGLVFELSPNPMPTTRSSTTPATATTRPPPTMPGAACRTGSPSTSPDLFSVAWAHTPKCGRTPLGSVTRAFARCSRCAVGVALLTAHASRSNSAHAGGAGRELLRPAFGGPAYGSRSSGRGILRPRATKSSWWYRGRSPNGMSCRRESFESLCRRGSSRSPADIVLCCLGLSPNF